MSDYTHENLALHGRHVPETHRTVNTDGSVDVVELPGTYEVGVEIEGVFKPLASFKAGKLLRRIEQGKQSQGSDTEQPSD